LEDSRFEPEFGSNRLSNVGPNP